MKYLKWQEKKIGDFSDANIACMYDSGFLFTRLGKGIMHQTRSVRINMTHFKPTSENRRILKKITDLKLNILKLPTEKYDWKIAKLAKDFYDTKFGTGIMSAQKIKELLTDESQSNFNSLFTYSMNSENVGYAICYESADILHYSYPFYDLKRAPKDAGLGMIIMAIQYAKTANKKYLYLGSLQRPGDTYKLQFNGLEWFDGMKWQNDMSQIKAILSDTKNQNEK